MKRTILFTIALMALLAASVNARTISDYIDWGATSHDFPQALEKWQPGTPFSPDDNFFISRVKPRARFTNVATQVHPEITPDIDKNLIYWVPIGTPPDNALPSANFDSDMFSMWSYVTHFGNWSAPMARIPGNFSDAAHRNGVGVSPVLGIPWGWLEEEWALTLRQLLDVGPEKVSDFLEYYGIDGLGYNSEFQLDTDIPLSERPKNVDEISAFNAALNRIAAQKGRPAFMNIWYDGTNDNGIIQFDNGLTSRNYNTFGDCDNMASSLFFNYNWNKASLLNFSANNARNMGRSPLDLYVGFNMQGGEPSKTSQSWTLLKDYPLSIGLWGAHSESMMYESRREMGASPLAIQKNYLLRTEWWFSGGSRNPASAPEISDIWNYSGENTDFFGMARMMSARSSLTEPFATNFNLGNGTYFNFKGKRQSNTSWANIGIQDILPTWRFWWSNRLLGGNPEDVASDALDASFTWDDAWLGGSSLRISGQTREPQYLHLFKTSINVAENQQIYLRYKLLNGHTNLRIVLSAEGAENVEIMLPELLFTYDYPSQEWLTKSFAISEVAPALIGKKISLVVLRFDSASNLEMLLGGFGITNGENDNAPATPLITRTELLSASSTGIDGKIIWEMPEGDVKRYNDEQGVSFFQLYYQFEGCEPVMQSGTSSWAGLILDAAPDNVSDNQKVRFGVAAVGTDFLCQSEIAWGEWHSFDAEYKMSHDITSYLANDVDCKPVHEIELNSEVVVTFKDYAHPAADWVLENSSGEAVLSQKGVTDFLVKLSAPGMYTLKVTYEGEDGISATEVYPNMLCAIDSDVAKAPRITDFKYSLNDCDELCCEFEAETGEGMRSRGLKMDGRAFGAKTADLSIQAYHPWSMAFWLCPDSFEEDDTHLLSVRDKTQGWPKNEWGWLWSTVGKDGKGIKVNIRKYADNGSVEYRFDDVVLSPGVWRAIGFSFGYTASNALDFALYMDGKRILPNSYSDATGEHAGAPEPLTGLYSFSRDNVVSIGGTLFKNGGVEGTIDNCSFWNTDLADGRAEIAAGALNIANFQQGMNALYTFEQNPDNGFTFSNELIGDNYPAAEAGTFQYVPQLTEGSGIMTFVAPNFGAGSPVLPSDAMVATEVKWIAPGAEIEQSGTAEKGEVILKYHTDAAQKVILRLENSCGYDQRETDIIFVPASATIKEISNNDISYRAQVMLAKNGLLALHFESAGEYEVEVVALDGRLVKKEHILSSGGISIIRDLPCDTPLVIMVK